MNSLLPPPMLPPPPIPLPSELSVEPKLPETEAEERALVREVRVVEVVLRREVAAAIIEEEVRLLPPPMEEEEEDPPSDPPPDESADIEEDPPAEELLDDREEEALDREEEPPIEPTEIEAIDVEEPSRPRPDRLPRVWGTIRLAKFSAAVTPVSRIVFSTAPVLTVKVRTAATGAACV